MNIKDISNKKFGRLTALHRSKSDNTKWTCLCDCGKYCDVKTSHLIAGHSKSCGCIKKEIVLKRNKEGIKYNCKNNRLYRIYYGMRTRCYNIDSEQYKYYGARGITICDEWNNSFENFRDWALLNGYSDNLTIDRIDNNRGYSPDNCRWATVSQQNANKRQLIATYKGETHTLMEWSKILGINYSSVYKRAITKGLSEDIVFDNIRNNNKKKCKGVM